MDSTDNKAARNVRRTVQGQVISAKMNKTIVVRVERLEKHPLYGKYLRKRSKYYAHDENQEARTGDTVVLCQCRPLSKLKRWRLIDIVHRAPELTGTPSTEA
ncbi:MAG: 30S ribosomal protein S17 [Planctomycetes bacterium]|nr:30S ribosomal protein S17 [Planctomycetota bacterium]